MGWGPKSPQTRRWHANLMPQTEKPQIDAPYNLSVSDLSWQIQQFAHTHALEFQMLNVLTMVFHRTPRLLLRHQSGMGAAHA